MGRPSTSVLKRQRERDRQQKKQEKARKKEQRAAEKERRHEERSQAEADPDIADIVPGPHHTPTLDDDKAW